MKFSIRPLPLCAASAGFLSIALAGAAPAQASPKIGPELEITVPFNSKTRDRFGSTLKGIGFGAGGAIPRAGGRFSPDIFVARESKNDNKLEFYGAGLQYRRTFSDAPSGVFVPFYGAGVGLAYGRVRLDDDDVDDSKIVPTGSVFVGTSVGRIGVLEARVRGVGKVGTLDFSGLTLTAGLRF